MNCPAQINQPSPLAPADQLSGNPGRLQPTGACAANLLGLSDQVPMRVVFLTDGRSKHALIGKLDIRLKRTSPRLMAAAGTISGLVIHALRYLGKAHVNELRLKSLASRLSPADRKRLLADAALAQTWIGDIMRRLAAKTFKLGRLPSAVDDLDPDANMGQYL
ncbi:MAG: DUF6088 family protein [Verrucomicrobiota bacterium]